MVSGSSLYTVTVSIDAVPTAHWKSICKDCAGGIDSLVELLQGRFSKGVMERICRQGPGCFRGRRRSASPAVARTTRRCASTSRRCCTASARGWIAQPELLFRLRAVDEKDLLAGIDRYCR